MSCDSDHKTYEGARSPSRPSAPHRAHGSRAVDDVGDGLRRASLTGGASSLSGDVNRRARPRPRGLQRAVRPAPDAGPEGGDRPARGRPRRGRARLRRAPRARRRARPRGGHRVPGPDRRAARAEVAADAARGRGGGPRPRAGRGGRGAARADARVPPLPPARPSTCASGSRRSTATATARAPLPPELRRVSLEAAEAAYDPTRLAEALGGLLRVPPPLDLRHVRRPRRVGGAAPAPPARPARAPRAASRSTRPSRAPTGSPRR